MMSLKRVALQARAKATRDILKQGQTKGMREPLDGQNLARKKC
jgi:hypothetical protein